MNNYYIGMWMMVICSQVNLARKDTLGTIFGVLWLVAALYFQWLSMRGKKFNHITDFKEYKNNLDKKMGEGSEFLKNNIKSDPSTKDIDDRLIKTVELAYSIGFKDGVMFEIEEDHKNA